MLQKDEAGLVW